MEVGDLIKLFPRIGCSFFFQDELFPVNIYLLFKCRNVKATPEASNNAKATVGPWIDFPRDVNYHLAAFPVWNGYH